MPNAPLRACSGCGIATGRGRCTNCSKRADQRRGSARARGYDTRWERRARLFKRTYRFCGMRPNGQPPVMSRCHELGIVTAVYQVDHVVPHRGDPVRFWDEQGNWQALCRECGARKSRAGL